MKKIFYILLIFILSCSNQNDISDQALELESENKALTGPVVNKLSPKPVENKTKPKSLKKAVIASRINTLLSLPMLLSMVMAQNLY